MTSNPRPAAMDGPVPRREQDVRVPPRPLKVEDLWALRFGGDPQVSPDGERVAYSVAEFDLEKNGYRSAIWVAPLRGGRPARFTQGRAQGGEAKDMLPRWSPDGRAIAFLSDRAGKDQLFVIPTGGGEARQLTSFDEAVSSPAWSPDGKRIAFVALPPQEQRKEGGARGGEPAHRADVRTIRRLRYKFNGMGFLDERRKQVWVVDVETGAVAQVTDGDADHLNPAWSPDGTRIAVEACRAPDPDLALVTDIWVFPAPPAAAAASPEAANRDAEPLRLTGGEGPSRRPAWSPDGRFIAYLGHTQGVTSAANVDVWVVPADGSAPARNLTRPLDLTFEQTVNGDSRYEKGEPGPVWSADDRAVYALATVGGDCRLHRIEVEDGASRALTPAGCVVTSFSAVRRPGAAAETIAALVGAPDNPGDVYAWVPEGADLPERGLRLTALNAATLAGWQLSLPEPLTFAGSAGRLEGWLMRPAGFAEGRRYPLVLQIHGGPHTSYGHSFFFEFQLLCSRGYAVLFTNPRGSTGYGERFCQAVIGDWGGGDYDDLMACLDQTLQRFPWIDPERLCVTGGSYGGYMTNWIVSHTDRFKAAVTQRSVTNLYSMFGTSDIGWYFTPREMGGVDLWDGEDRILERSPIRHARNVKTPLLIIHSDEDHRCPVEQAEQWFVALKRLGVTTEFVRFGGENHELSRSGKPYNRRERLARIVDWFERHVEPGPRAPAAAGGGGRPGEEARR